ncbi:MAG TPA: hypothetical protein VJ852_05445 [Gemmatimonadaceae bacterium]|nr:hypothetical protein [Gemmatimonadaceae bacterium]
MIVQLALRNITYRPWRSVLMFFGFGVGVAVMIVLLSVGQALLTQARQEKLVGGGTITVLPEGLDVEVMKTGGIGGLFFSIDHASFLYRQVMASPRYASEVAAVAPQIEGRLVYLRTTDGREFAAHASGEIPDASRAVGAAPDLVAGKWENDAGDRRWIAPTLLELRNEIDHFHIPDDSVANRDTWAEWHYFNVMARGEADRGKGEEGSGNRWAFISFIVGGDVTSSKWGGQVGITLRDEGGATRRFARTVDKSQVRFATTDANLRFGASSVTVLPDGDYQVRAAAPEQNGGGRISVDLRVHPAPFAYFPGVSMSSGGFVSGYVVPGLRATATGRLCVDNDCEQLSDAQSYHDHNWGVWRNVTWEWGASRAGQYTFLYGRVYPPDSTTSVPPMLVYLTDSLGFRAVFRPREISYEDNRQIRVGANPIRVPSRATLYDARGADTLRIDVTIDDAIGTDTRPASAERGSPVAGEKAHPYFIQMKGTARISGRIDGTPLTGSGTGFFETYR